MSVKVTMYCTNTCPFCAVAENLLTDLGVQDLTKLNIEDNPKLRSEMMELTGRHTVPQIFIGSEHIGGCDDLHDAHERGLLVDKLKLPG